MLGGQPPFTGPTVESVIHQHMSADPRSITELRPMVPEEIAAAIGRALVKTPADRFSTASEFAAALASGDTGVTTGATAVSQGRSWRGPWTVAGAAGVALIAFVMLRGGDTAPFSDGRPMLAVLPFENLGAPDDEYFADGQRS
jgi:serine/threonine-protein kinase